MTKKKYVFEIPIHLVGSAIKWLLKITSKATIFEKTTILKKKNLHFAAPSLLGASLFKKKYQKPPFG